MNKSSLYFLKNNWLKIPVSLYAIGFVVHNSYLSAFGSYEFELVQAKYILSGLGVVAFNIICFAYIAIKVNLSYIPDMYEKDKFLPWLLRIFSLPYVIYSFFYPDLPIQLFLKGNDLTNLSLLLFELSNIVVVFSIFDLMFMYSDSNSFSAKIIRSIFKILAIPVVLITFIIARNNSEFLSVTITSIYSFLGLIGWGLAQNDEKLGINPNYLDSNAKNKHQDLFKIFFGFIAVSFMLWTVISNYVKIIYPKIPFALGGAKIQLVEINSKNKKTHAKLIQETENWTLYINKKSGRVEKIRSNLINKIIYLEPKK